MEMDPALPPSTVRNCHRRHRCPLLFLQFCCGLTYPTLG